MYLLFGGEALTLHGVLIVGRELTEELPVPIQRSVCPRDGTKTLRDELHVLHGLKRIRGSLLWVSFTVAFHFTAACIFH